MVVVFRINRIASEQRFCRKMAQAYTKRNVKIRVKFFFAKTPKKIPILIVVFQRPVKDPSTTEMRGPVLSADVFFGVVYQPKICKIGKNV